MADATGAPSVPDASDRPVRRARSTTVGQVARYLGAVALLGEGVDHLWQFSVDSYSVIPTIGTLFALNFASALVVALGLAAPVERLGRRWGRAVLSVLAGGGVGIALGSLVGLEVSENTRLFGFTESGYRGGIVVSIVLEAATVIFLLAFLGAGWRSRPPVAVRPRRRARRATSPATRRSL